MLSRVSTTNGYNAIQYTITMKGICSLPTWTLHRPDNCTTKCTAAASASVAVDTTCRYIKTTLQLIGQEEKELTTSKQVFCCAQCAFFW